MRGFFRISKLQRAWHGLTVAPLNRATINNSVPVIRKMIELKTQSSLFFIQANSSIFHCPRWKNDDPVWKNPGIYFLSNVAVLLSFTTTMDANNLPLGSCWEE